MADWHYIGHYGQLGPLSDSQMAELVTSGVIERETYVWCDGMADWLPAASVPDLAAHFAASPIPPTPPPPPPRPFGQRASQIPPSAPPPQVPMYTPQPPPGGFAGSAVYGLSNPYPGHLMPAQRSDKNRVLAGILNIVLPGLGRMYLGYSMIGVIQFVLIFTGIGILWAFIDGLLMLTGNVKEDGYGRELV